MSPSTRNPLCLRLRAAAWLVGTVFASLAGGTEASEPVTRTVLGRWVTPGIGAVVELGPCEKSADALCGRIAWLWDGLDGAGKPKTDGKNPDTASRARALIGADMLRDFRSTAPGTWTGGSVYDPSDGHTYSGSIRLIEAGVLELEGCAFRIFCQRQVWRRPDAILQIATW